MSGGNPVTPPGTGPAHLAGPSTIGSVLPTPSDHAHNRLGSCDAGARTTSWVRRDALASPVTRHYQDLAV
jgi:hypothetical protein